MRKPANKNVTTKLAQTKLFFEEITDTADFKTSLPTIEEPTPRISRRRK